MKSNLKKAKDAAWLAFARYIKLRDCLQTTGTKTHCVCVTCNKTVPYGRELHAGHAIGGRGNSILLDPDIVHGQCNICNNPKFGKGGNYAVYSVWMVKTYGLEAWEGMVALSKQPETVKEWEWREKAEYYKEKADVLDSLMED